jgi:hypothetical protein
LRGVSPNAGGVIVARTVHMHPVRVLLASGQVVVQHRAPMQTGAVTCELQNHWPDRAMKDQPLERSPPGKSVAIYHT